MTSSNPPVKVTRPVYTLRLSCDVLTRLKRYARLHRVAPAAAARSFIERSLNDHESSAVGGGQ